MLEALLEYRPDGLILVSPRLAGPQIAADVGTVPCVIIGRRLRNRHIDCVMTNEAVGAQLAVRHLVELGHQDIAHVDGGRGAGAAPRRTGYLRAMDEAGLRRRARVVRGEFTEDAGSNAADELLRSGDLPTAVFAANDLVAIGLIDRLDQDGVRVPEDVSVVGFDNTFVAAFSHIRLTTINQPRQEMGREALQLLLERAEGRDKGTTRLHEPELVERGTTARPR
jgi:DNA-binding LacI/PurR family transcriptional regulator